MNQFNPLNQYASGPLPLYRRRPFSCILLLLLLLFILWRIIGAFLDYADQRGLFSGPRLGVLRVEGFIADSRDARRWAESLQQDETIAGVLLRIDSPGGAVAPAQEIYEAVKRLAAVKPVVVSMGTAAASGGYYIAVAGQELFANPATLTGSIGVKLQLTNVQGLAEKIGVSSLTLATGPYKNAGSPFESLTEDQRAYREGLLRDMQEQFVAVIVENRKMPEEKVLSLANGKAYTGRQALEYGLIDALGDEEAAIARLAERCGIPRSSELVEAPAPEKPWWQGFLSLLGAQVEQELSRKAVAPEIQFYF